MGLVLEEDVQARAEALAEKAGIPVDDATRKRMQECAVSLRNSYHSQALPHGVLVPISKSD